jgi:hypothetical protein
MARTVLVAALGTSVGSTVPERTVLLPASALAVLPGKSVQIVRLHSACRRVLFGSSDG